MNTLRNDYNKIEKLDKSEWYLYNVYNLNWDLLGHRANKSTLNLTHYGDYVRLHDKYYKIMVKFSM